MKNVALSWEIIICGEKKSVEFFGIYRFLKYCLGGYFGGFPPVNTENTKPYNLRLDKFQVFQWGLSSLCVPASTRTFLFSFLMLCLEREVLFFSSHHPTTYHTSHALRLPWTLLSEATTHAQNDPIKISKVAAPVCTSLEADWYSWVLPQDVSVKLERGFCHRRDLARRANSNIHPVSSISASSGVRTMVTPYSQNKKNATFCTPKK